MLEAPLAPPLMLAAMGPPPIVGIGVCDVGYPWPEVFENDNAECCFLFFVVVPDYLTKSEA